MLKGNAFLKATTPGAQPFSGGEFQQLVAAVVGANQDINAPILAFIAFKLAELLGDVVWNVRAQKIDTGVASKYGFNYLTFLDMAVARAGTTIVARCPAETEGDEDRELWLRIAYDASVRSFCFLCFSVATFLRLHSHHPLQAARPSIRQQLLASGSSDIRRHDDRRAIHVECSDDEEVCWLFAFTDRFAMFIAVV